MKVRELFVEDSTVFVVDGLMDEMSIDDFYTAISKQGFFRQERDSDQDEYPIFSFDFEPVEFSSSDKVGIIATELVHSYFHENLYLQRAYVNLCHYGDMEYPHRDCELGEKAVTALYYPMTSWTKEWGGETIFYEDGESKYAISPKPGRFVIFSGELEHMGTLPTRICSQSRYTVALKFKIKR
ncbi:2OG-Fe(II) oxygenase [Vibrio splendidus]